jgi:hypothetical protein
MKSWGVGPFNNLISTQEYEVSQFPCQQFLGDNISIRRFKFPPWEWSNQKFPNWELFAKGAGTIKTRLQEALVGSWG